MPSAVVSPEHVILARTITTLKAMAANREFVRSADESVRSINPAAVLRWITLEGASHNQNDGIVNVPKPGLLVTPLPVKSAYEGGVSCATDEVVTVVVQIVDDTSSSRASSGPYRTYVDWMNRIRYAVLEDLMIFRQDFDPAIADPYVTLPKDRIPSDPQKLWRHQQQVAAFSFFVKVRHYRSRGA